MRERHISGPLKKSSVNPESPLLKEASPRGKSISEPPKINAGATSGSGGKRVINTETHPSKTSSTFTAPRQGESHNPVDCGYTKPGKM